MNTPKVSVVMSVYNSERYLLEAVESILRQTFTDFEFIIVDDGSTDGTWEILTSYATEDPRIVLIRNEKNIGLTQSLNKGLVLARGEYIARQDADDVSEPERLEKQVAYLEAYPLVGLVGTAYEIISGDGQLLTTVYPPTDNGALQERLLEGNCFCHGAVVFRRICLAHVGGYREAFRTAQDHDLWLRISEHFDLASLPDRLYRYRFHSTAVSVQQLELQVANDGLARDLARERRQNGQERMHLNGDSTLPVDILLVPEPGTLAQRHLWHAYLLYLLGDDDTATEHFLRAITADPSLLGDISRLYDWLSGHAQAIAQQRQSYEAGERFILTLLSGARRSDARFRKLEKKVLGTFHIAAAFESYARRDMRLVRHHVVAAAHCDMQWLCNRGVLSIGLESTIGECAAGLVRHLSSTWRRTGE